MFTHSLFSKMNRLSFPNALRVAQRRLELGQHQQGNWLREKAQKFSGELSLRGAMRFLQNTAFKVGPLALTTTLTTNIFNPGTTAGGVNCTSAPFDKLYVLITHVRVINKTGTAATVSLWLGATGANTAGTEFIWSGYSVPANSYIDEYGRWRMGTADFIVGGAGTTTALTITLEGEIGIGA